MKYIFSIALVGLFTLNAFSQSNELPSVIVKDIDGKDIDIASFGKKEQITVLNFWATWCTPCKKELNNMVDLYDEWKEKYNVEIVAVSVDDARNAAKVKTYANGQEWNYTILLDMNQDLQRALNFQTVPYTIMLNKKGEIVYKHNGYVEGDEIELEEKIKELAQGE
jgi:cytochrome c biogenesis protein CcmG, thiol:disulfide interchange protein DsbE